MCKISLINLGFSRHRLLRDKMYLGFLVPFEVQYYNASVSLNMQVIKPGVKGSFVFTKISIEPPVKHLHVTIIWLKMVVLVSLRFLLLMSNWSLWIQPLVLRNYHNLRVQSSNFGRVLKLLISYLVIWK